MDGIFIDEFNSAKEYVELYGGSPSHISTVLTNRKFFYNKKIILFSNDVLNIHDIKFVKKKHKLIEVLLFDINNNFIKKFNSVKECAKFIGCKDAEIRMCCLGRRSRIKNFITKYCK